MTKEKRHEVVISGIAGVFPESDDVDELWTKLMNKDENFVTVDSRRWVPGELGVPAGVGKLREPSCFDMSFFGVSRRLCINMDPLTKLCLEQSFRAVCDAGINPGEMSGANCAVLMSSVTSETEYDCVIRGQNLGTAILGHSRTMQSNRISYFMNLKGPSFMIDSSWCGGMQGLQYAHDLVSEGHTSSALVGSCSQAYRAEVSTHYQAMGRISPDNKTRCFSADASGYARSEACVVFFVQRLEDARRSYGTIMSAMSTNLGSRLTPFTELNEDKLRELIEESYKKAEVSPNELAYLEASGSALKEVDAKELRAASDVLLRRRNAPLRIGSIKSNLGHCEGAAGMVGAAKAALVLDRGFIPANLNYDSPNPEVPALVSGKMQVVTETTPLNGDIVGVTEIGAAGNFSHMVLRRYNKEKKMRRQVGELPPDGLPRVVIMSDRSDYNLLKNRERLQTMAIDEEFVSLMNNLYKDGIKGHLYRGFTVLDGQDNHFNQIDQYHENATKRPIWFMFSGMGSQWPTMGRALMRLPVFAKAVQKCHDTLQPKGVNVLDILTKDDLPMFDTILHSFVGIAAVQIGLVDVLKTLGIEPDGIVGHSVGELGCAYADGCFTAEQMILSAYARGRASVEAELIQGMMAAVGKGYNQIKDEIPPSIEVACHNSSTSCTLSGPTKDMEAYIAEVKDQGVFAKLVNVANIAYHSRYIKPAAPALLKYLKEVIPSPKPRSPRWVSSSIPQNQWGSDLAKTSSAEYHTNNLLCSVLFEEATAHIPSNAIVIEIAPHGLLQAIVRRSLPEATHIPLTNRFEEENLMFLLAAAGKMYVQGISVDVQKLYPPVEYPVSRETPAISPFIGWQHNEEFIVDYFNETSCRKVPCWKELEVLLTEEKYSVLSHHKIKGRIAIPLSFYINSIIELYSDYDPSITDSPVSFDNIDHIFDVEIPKSSICLFAQILRGSGHFSFFSNGQLAVKGTLSKMEKSSVSTTVDFDDANYLDGKQLTTYMRRLGLNLSGRFDAIQRFSLKDNHIKAVIKWNGSIQEFLGNVFTVVSFYESKLANELRIVSRIVKLVVDHTKLTGHEEINVEYSALTKLVKSNTIQGLILEAARPTLSFALTKNLDFLVETYEFVPYTDPDVSKIKDLMPICSQLVIENLYQPKEKSCTVRIVGIGGENPFFQALHHVSQLLQSSHVFHMETVLNEDEFYLRDMSFIHQELIWVICPFGPSVKLMKSLSAALKGFLLMPRSIYDLSQAVQVIEEFTYNKMDYVLCSVSGRDKRKYQVVDIKDNFIDTLRYKLSKANEDNWKADTESNVVILAGKYESITSTVAIIEEAERLPHSNLIHYLFSDREFSGSNLSNQFKNQINKDLRQNIYCKSVWGSLQRLPSAENASETPKNDKVVYTLGSVAEGDVTALGLNLSDVTASLVDDGLGLFDYATPKTMGVASFDTTNKAFMMDPFLKWDKPSSWTDIDAATVPLLYSLAVDIVYFKNNALQEEITDNNAILVTRGLLPLSQAVIMLALHEQLEIFATVGSGQEKSELLAMFPQLNPQHILDHTKNDFYIHAKRLKNGRGMTKIVCTLEDEDKIVAAQNCFDDEYGILILVSQSQMDGRASFGLIVFRKQALAVGVNAESLVNSSKSAKALVRDKVQTLIENGVIKPFKYTTVSSDSLNLDVIDVIRPAKSKVVVNLKRNDVIESHKFVCDRSKNYVIICGQRQLDLWLDLAEWLLKRDAVKVTIFLTQTALTTVTSLRFQSLASQYFGAKVTLMGSKHISSKPAMTRFLVELSQREGIDSIFFIGTDLRGKIQEIDDILRSLGSLSRMVCLGHGGETVCQRRSDEGLDSLCVRCSLDALGCPDVLRYLEPLLIKCSARPVVLLTEQLHNEASKNTRISNLHTFYIPETLPELTELLRLTSDKPGFSGLQTNTLRHCHAKEINPLFVIQGLKPHLTAPLCDQLFFPALEARLPPQCTHLDFLASELVDKMVKYPYNFFTILTDGLGVVLALHIGTQLEALGKRVKVIMLDGTPETAVRVASELLRDEVALIDKYLKLSSKTKSIVKSQTTWEEKLQAAIDGSILDHEDCVIAARAMDLLRNRLQLISNHSPPKNQIRTKCHLFKFDTDFSETTRSGLDVFLETDHILHMKGGETVAENMNLTADDVNTLMLFEYREAAYPPAEDHIGANIIKNTCFHN